MNVDQTTNAPSPSAAMVQMVERLTSEGLINLVEAGKMFGESRGSVVAPATLSRWILKGVKVGGRTHRLEGIRIGGRRLMTSRWAVYRFLAAQQTPIEHDTQPPMPRSSAERRKSNERVEAELVAMGL